MAMKPEEAGRKLDENSMKDIQEAETMLDYNINLHYNGADKIKINIKIQHYLTANGILELEKRYKEAGWKKLICERNPDITYELTNNEGHHKIILYA